MIMIWMMMLYTLYEIKIRHPTLIDELGEKILLFIIDDITEDKIYPNNTDKINIYKLEPK